MLLPQGTEEKGIPRLVFGSSMFVLLLEGKKGSLGGGPRLHNPPHKLLRLKQQPLLSVMLWVGCTS